ncbi:MAG: hypothetical protein GDA48_02355 [Hormoscilla sp. GM102CHS1]|nr:hypothetical protein [Hormoscilla sp. GM102CHS1]
MTVSCAIHPTEHRLLKKGEKLEDYLSPIYLNVSSRKYTPESPGASQLFMTEYVDEFMTKIDKSMGNNFNKKIPCILDEDKQHTNLPCCILLEITSLTYGEETGHWYGKMSTLGFQNVGLRDRINREHDYEQQQRTIERLERAGLPFKETHRSSKVWQKWICPPGQNPMSGERDKGLSDDMYSDDLSKYYD